MFCTNCGSELSDGLKFCIYCGTPLYEAESVVEAAREPVIEPVGRPVVEEPVPEPIGRPRPKEKGLLVLLDVTDSNKFYGCGLDQPVILGREADKCDVVIQGDKSVSRRHCRFFCQGGSCYVEDLNSVNHTFLNGVMVETPQRIQAGDHLKFGMVEVVVAECELGS